MRYSIKIPSYLIITILLSVLVTCKEMSESFMDENAGMNGGFEISQNGLPVNWLWYTPKIVPDSKFEIILDQENFKEGQQSLKFDIETCSPKGGLNSPGFTNQFDAIPGKQYEISFWTLNDGTEYQVSAGGVSPMGGDMQVLLKSDSSHHEWMQHTLTTDNIKKDQQLRIEINILKPGTFWIDDLKIIEH